MTDRATANPGTDAENTLSDLTRAWRLLHESALLVDLSDRGRLQMEGPQAATVMNGLVTNEIAALAPGEGRYAAALTPKGKVLADVTVFRTGVGVLAIVPRRAAEGFLAMIRKYVNPRLARYRDVSDETMELGIFGPRAGEAVVAAADTAIELPAPLWAHRDVVIAGNTLLVARVPDAGIAGFVLIGPAPARDAVQSRLLSAGAQLGDARALDAARIEAGRPAWGRDMDDTTLAQEARLDALEAISYEKGCYTGQETVARLHFRGHVNRFLRGLRLDRPDVPEGAAVWWGDREAGKVRSVAVSPRLGPIALAMVRREVPDDADVAVRWDDGAATGRVVQLPFA